jgi:hypothetical protein
VFGFLVYLLIAAARLGAPLRRFERKAAGGGRLDYY